MKTRVLLSLFLLILQTHPTDNASPTFVFRLILSVSERLPLIFDYKKIVEDIINPSDNVDKQVLAVLEILQKEQHEIKVMIFDLQTSVDFYQYLSQIGSAQTDIASVNEDYEELQNASNENEERDWRTHFLENYKSRSVDTHIRNLRDRAKGIAILSLEAMPVLLAKKLKCNMTAVRLFQKGYLSLMMNGYGLKGIYVNMTGGDGESQVNDWIGDMNWSITGLLTADQTCMNNYREYAIQDFEGIDSVETLHKTIQEKYTWLEAFIASFSKRGFQYNAISSLYLKINNVFKTESNTKVMVFCEKKGNGSASDETKDKIFRDISKYQNARTGEGDNEAAKHILNSILETTSSIGINPYAIIIFADHSGFPVKDIVTGYCANEVSFQIIYATVKEESSLVWEQRTYNNVKYHVHIFLPSRVIDQPINDFNPNNSYRKELSASCREKAYIRLLILLAAFVFLYLRSWE